MSEETQNETPRTLLQTAMDYAHFAGHTHTRPFHLLAALADHPDYAPHLENVGFPVDDLDLAIDAVYDEFVEGERPKSLLSSLTYIGNAHFDNRVVLICDAAQNLVDKMDHGPEGKAMALLMLLESSGDTYTKHVLNSSLGFSADELLHMYSASVLGSEGDYEFEFAEEQDNDAPSPDGDIVLDDHKVLNLGASLKTKVFFQDTAIDAIEDSFLEAKAGLKDPNQPIANYLFLGPTGVGKTEVAKQTSNELGIPLVRLDMSEYSDGSDISKLIGGGPKWVGYEQEGTLTGGVDKNPHCVLLLDEIEKAHPEVFNLLLQVMDHGELTSGQGDTIDFRNVILMMTSNAGAVEATRERIGFNNSANDNGKADYDAATKRIFTPEFRNRLTATIQFDNLPKAAIPIILQKKIDELNEYDGCLNNNITVRASDEVLEKLASDIYDETQNGRVAQRAVQQFIRRPLSRLILSGTKDAEIELQFENGKFSLAQTPKKDPQPEPTQISEEPYEPPVLKEAPPGLG